MKSSEFDKLVKTGKTRDFTAMGETFRGLPTRRDGLTGYIWYTFNNVDRLGTFNISDLGVQSFSTEYMKHGDITQTWIDDMTVLDLNCYDHMVIAGHADSNGIVKGYDIEAVILLDSPSNLDIYEQNRLIEIVQNRDTYGDPDYVYIGDTNGGWIDYLRSPGTYVGRWMRIDTEWLVNTVNQW